MRRPLYLLALSVAIVLVAAPAALAQTEGLNCEHFANQEAAQAILDAHGDLYGHDPEGDGVACEDLGGGTAEDGTLAPFAQYAQQQYQYSSGGTVEKLADTGGPSLLIPAAAGTLVLMGACIVGLFLLAARRGSRAGDLGSGGQMAIDLVGPNAKRLAAVVVAVVVAVVLAAVVGQATTRSASAQTGEHSISMSVHPGPRNAIPVGTNMDFLITVSNNSPNPYRGATVTQPLPYGVSFVDVNASQGPCYSVASSTTCQLGTIAPGNVAHINVIVTAITPGTYTSVAQDGLGNQADVTYTIVPTQYSGGGGGGRGGG